MSHSRPDRMMSPEEIASHFGVEFEAENERRDIEYFRRTGDLEHGEELVDCLRLADALNEAAGHAPVQGPAEKLPPLRSVPSVR